MWSPGFDGQAGPGQAAVDQVGPVLDLPSDLSVVNVSAALAGRPAVTGRIPAGMFQPEMALMPGGQQLLVSNFASGQVEAVSVPTTP